MLKLADDISFNFFVSSAISSSSSSNLLASSFELKVGEVWRKLASSCWAMVSRSWVFRWASTSKEYLLQSSLKRLMLYANISRIFSTLWRIALWSELYNREEEKLSFEELKSGREATRLISSRQVKAWFNSPSLFMRFISFCKSEVLDLKVLPCSLKSSSSSSLDFLFKVFKEVSKDRLDLSEFTRAVFACSYFALYSVTSACKWTPALSIVPESQSW